MLNEGKCVLADRRYPENKAKVLNSESVKSKMLKTCQTKPKTINKNLKQFKALSSLL